MTLPRFAVVVALCVSTVVATPRVARADDPAMRSAKRHHERGEKLFALGKFAEALDEYQKAFDAKPVPAFLFNIGQCHRNLGDYEAAIFSYKKYLKLDPEASNREKVEKLIDELEQKQQAAESQRLHIDKPRQPPPPPPPATEAAFYTKWWFWTGVAVVGAAGGVGIYEATKSGPPPTPLGNVGFGK